jgi:hypothetical protein
VDPGGSIASVWPHPLPPASVPSFADNSTPNSPPLAPHPLFPPICLSPRPPALSIPPPARGPGVVVVVVVGPLLLPLREYYVRTHARTYTRRLQGYRCVRGFITGGAARGDVCCRARDDESPSVYVCPHKHARARTCARTEGSTEDWRGGGAGEAARGVTHFLAFHLFCLPTLFTPEPYFVNGSRAAPVDARRLLRCESNGRRRFSCARSPASRRRHRHRHRHRRCRCRRAFVDDGGTVDESRYGAYATELSINDLPPPPDVIGRLPAATRTRCAATRNAKLQ